MQVSSQNLRHSFITPASLAWAIVALCIPLKIHASDHSTEHWQYRSDVYLWASGVGGETADGAELDIDFTDLARDLELGAMVTIAAERNQWLFEADVIYLDVEDDDGIDVSAEEELKQVELSGWIFNPFVGYKVLESEHGYLTAIAGARYLDLELGLDVRVSSEEGSERVSATESEDFLDGIVGVIGRIALSDKWAIPYYLDVGTGDTDFTWQAYLGVSYAFESFEMLAGYRYLDWDFEDDEPAFSELDLGGPMLGARWHF